MTNKPLLIRWGSARNNELFNTWSQDIKDQGKKVETEARKVLIEHFKTSQDSKHSKRFWDEMFYTIRKAMFASMVGFTNKIKKEYFTTYKEVDLLNKKVNLVLNVLLKNKELEFTEENLEVMGGGIINEFDFFKEQRFVYENDINQMFKSKKEQIKSLQNAADVVEEQFKGDYTDEDQDND